MHTRTQPHTYTRHTDLYCMCAPIYIHGQTNTHARQHTQTDTHTGKCTATTPLARPAAMENLEIKTNLLFIPSRSNRQTGIQSFEGGRDVHTTLDEGIFRDCVLTSSQLEWFCQQIKVIFFFFACVVMNSGEGCTVLWWVFQIDINVELSLPQFKYSKISGKETYLLSDWDLDNVRKSILILCVYI